MSKRLLRGAALLVLAALGWLLRPQAETDSGTADLINPVLGNASFRARFGHEPQANDGIEGTRIAKHLAYVEQLLRTRDVRGLPVAQRRRRAAMLDHLHRYRTAGVFPRNEKYPQQRRPCFIDGDGRICAVGYLVEQTAGRALAERINGQHQYDYIRDMRSSELLAWVGQSGLSLQECAMIQPTYGWGPTPPADPNHVPALYGAGTAVWSGLNAPLVVLNGAQVLNGRRQKGLAVAGLVSGVGQVALGSIVLLKEQPYFGNDGITNETKKAVSFLNIGLGTASAVMGAWNLCMPRAVLPGTTVSVGSYASPAEPSGGVLTLTRRF